MRKRLRGIQRQVAQTRPTATDVARAAGVSTATVSRAMQRDGVVSQETRERVLEIAASLRYRPNNIARGLARRQNSLIGVVVGDITNPFYPEVIERLTKRLTNAGLHTMLVNMVDGIDIEETLAPLLEYQVKAAVFVAAPYTSDACDICRSHHIPSFLLNRSVRRNDITSVTCDNLAGGRLVAELLINAGHQKLAYISGRPDTSTNRDRAKGFSDVLRESGHGPCIIEPGGTYSYEGGYNAALRLIRAQHEVDAVFCANDIIALGALDALRHALGMKVPNDISVIGFDDIAAASWPAYDLTTVRQPLERMIDVLVSAILRGDGGESEKKSGLVAIPGELVARSSARLSERPAAPALPLGTLGAGIE
jgi:DNA-binding LacI/PurR family transcriptional regulator